MYLLYYAVLIKTTFNGLNVFYSTLIEHTYIICRKNEQRKVNDLQPLV